MATNNPKPKKKDFFWLTVIVGACFVFLISILVGRFLSSYLTKTIPTTQAIKMPEGSPLPKNYTTLTPYTLLSGTQQTVLTPVAAATQTAKGANLTAVVKQEVKTEEQTPPEEAAVNEDETGQTQTQTETNTTPQTKPVKINKTTKKDSKTTPPSATTPQTTEKQVEQKETTDAQVNTVFKVQLGAFSTKDNAQNLINELKGKGVDATVVPLKKDGKDYFRVQAGAYKNKESAGKIADDLKKQGYPVFISGK